MAIFGYEAVVLRSSSTILVYLYHHLYRRSTAILPPSYVLYHPPTPLPFLYASTIPLRLYHSSTPLPFLYASTIPLRLYHSSTPLPIFYASAIPLRLYQSSTPLPTPQSFHPPLFPLCVLTTNDERLTTCTCGSWLGLSPGCSPRGTRSFLSFVI